MSVKANLARNFRVVQDRSEAESKFVTVKGARLHFVVQGSGRPVVLIHGNPGSFHDWANVFDRLASRFSTYAFDRPGHGRSERPRHNGVVTPEVQAALLNQALRELHVERPILVGHSWGGSLALIYALLFPNEVAGLVLLAPAAYPFDDGLSILHRVPSWPVIGDIINLLVTPLLSPRLVRASLAQAFAPEPVPDNYLRHALAEWTSTTKVKWYSIDESLLSDSLAKFSLRYPDLRLPVAIVSGDSDLIVPAAENAVALARALPQAQLRLLKNTGHQIPFVYPEVVAQAVERIAAIT